MNCDICKFVKEAKNPVLETKYWKVLLANDQAYLGRCYVSLKRHCGDLAELKTEEWNELLVIIHKLEKSIMMAFGADLFNWTCLMNMAYQNSPPNPHVHWHFRPRYSRPINFAGLTFEDPEFGSHYARETERSFEVPESVQREILEKITGEVVEKKALPNEISEVK
jgi:diadenosine tetraphosphate (Ap4A) HIT family hydrolase